MSEKGNGGSWAGPEGGPPTGFDPNAPVPEPSGQGPEWPAGDPEARAKEAARRSMEEAQEKAKGGKT